MAFLPTNWLRNDFPTSKQRVGATRSSGARTFKAPAAQNDPKVVPSDRPRVARLLGDAERTVQRIASKSDKVSALASLAESRQNGVDLRPVCFSGPGTYPSLPWSGQCLGLLSSGVSAVPQPGQCPLRWLSL